MNLASLRDHIRRQERLDEEWLHLFAVAEMIPVLRSEPAYRVNGQTGLTLLKTDPLRVVLEVAQDGHEIGSHTVRGPTLIHVLEGSLRLRCGDESRAAHAGEMVVVPHDRPREIRAQGDVAFLWVLSPDVSDA